MSFIPDQLYIIMSNKYFLMIMYWNFANFCILQLHLCVLSFEQYCYKTEQSNTEQDRTRLVV